MTSLYLFLSDGLTCLVARYFCEHLGNEGYHKWVPHAESEGVCESVDPSEASTAPFPPKFKVLIFGNSHLRQARGTSRQSFFFKVMFSALLLIYLPVESKSDHSRCRCPFVRIHAQKNDKTLENLCKLLQIFSIELLDCGEREECTLMAETNLFVPPPSLSRRHQVVEALMCIFSKDVKSQKVKYADHGQNTDMIGGNVGCRHSSWPDWATLVDHHCVRKDADAKART